MRGDVEASEKKRFSLTAADAWAKMDASLSLATLLNRGEENIEETAQSGSIVRGVGDDHHPRDKVVSMGGFHQYIETWGCPRLLHQLVWKAPMII
ncbi:unnamed protein product [Lota lota]